MKASVSLSSGVWRTLFCLMWTCVAMVSKSLSERTFVPKAVSVARGEKRWVAVSYFVMMHLRVPSASTTKFSAHQFRPK